MSILRCFASFIVRQLSINAFETVPKTAKECFKIQKMLFMSE